jgi:hypothetical protein
MPTLRNIPGCLKLHRGVGAAPSRGAEAAAFANRPSRRDRAPGTARPLPGGGSGLGRQSRNAARKIAIQASTNDLADEHASCDGAVGAVVRPV